MKIYTGSNFKYLLNIYLFTYHDLRNHYEKLMMWGELMLKEVLKHSDFFRLFSKNVCSSSDFFEGRRKRTAFAYQNLLIWLSLLNQLSRHNIFNQKAEKHSNKTHSCLDVWNIKQETVSSKWELKSVSLISFPLFLVFNQNIWSHCLKWVYSQNIVELVEYRCLAVEEKHDRGQIPLTSFLIWANG